jgi:ribosome-associated protein
VRAPVTLITFSGVIISSDLVIPDSELTYRATRSGGPGGQHVNTSSTRIELWWDLGASPALSEEVRARLLTRLASRVDSSGMLRLVSSGSRSQLQNRREVTERFQELLAKAMVLPRKRKKTKPTRASKERRLESKKRQGARKALRRRPAAE